MTLHRGFFFVAKEDTDALPLGSPMRPELPLLHSLGGLTFWGGYSRHASRIKQNLVCTCKTKSRFLYVDWLRKGLYGGQQVGSTSQVCCNKEAARFFLCAKLFA